jgi:HEAT repeat protein
MEIPAKKWLALLSDDASVEVRAAALLIMGELALKDAELASAVRERLTDVSAEVRQNAIRTVGLLKVDAALPELLERIGHGGPEAALAAEAAAKLGAKGVKGLQDLMHKVVPGVRKYIAAALTSSTSSSGDATALGVLTDNDPQIASSAASAIIAKIPEYTATRKSSLARELVDLVRNKKRPIPPPSEPPVVRVLVALNDPIAADVLWDRVLLPHPPDVRTMALSAVGGWLTSPTNDQLAKLVHCACEPDFRIVAPALQILSKLPENAKFHTIWMQLLKAPDFAARRLAMQKVGTTDTAEVALGLLAQLHHKDASTRDIAVHQLRNLKAGRAALANALLDVAGHDECWNLARLVASFVKQLTPAIVTKLTEQAFEYFAKHDHRTEPFLHVLRELDATKLNQQIVETAVEFRKKKKYAEALVYLKTLARDPSIGFAIRWELALNGLKVSPHEVALQSRESDPCLRSFDTLFQQDPDLLMKELEKAKLLEPEDLFYVGFHFAEQLGRQRLFGIELLQLVTKRAPKSEVGKNAKNKLKSVGA